MPGWLDRILRRKPAETRAPLGSIGYAEFGLGPITTGSYINPRIVENLSTVLACVGAISSTLATLPAFVYRQGPRGRSEARDHPVSALIRRPNERQTWPDFIEMMLAQTLLFGNAIAVVEHDNAGEVTALIPIPWQNVQVYLLANCKMVYEITQFIAPWGGVGAPKRYLDGEVLHIKDRSDDGFLGRSRLSRAPEVLEQAIGIQKYAASVWRNSASPGGILRTAGKLSKEARESLGASWEGGFMGAINAKKTPILEEGLDFTPVSISPEDAEVLASRRFTVEELCRLYQVPPPIVQDYSHGTFTNTAQAALWFAQLTLTPWARKIEAEFGRVLFGDDGCHLEIDLTGLMRGDYTARWQAYAIAVSNGILTVDEIREAEGYNPVNPKGPMDPVVPDAG